MPEPPTSDGSSGPPGELRRAVGLGGAVMMGLGSIIGTGVFVSIGIAAGVAGPSVVLAIAIAAVVACCNGLSSAQLAAAYPVSGGTYEYGYRRLTPLLGFTAGWLSLTAKSASAATAALGVSFYALRLFGRDGDLVTVVALGVVVLLTLLVLMGIRRSSAANIAIVSLTLVVLALFVVVGLPAAVRGAGENLTPVFPSIGGVPGLLEAAALMFVAYTGYGRIATLGEEVAEPRRTIPRAMVITLLATMTIYLTVALVAVASAGAEAIAPERAGGAPLEAAAEVFAGRWLAWVLVVGAGTAMLGVLLNLILGLSRVVLAMARRADLPPVFARVGERSASPQAAVVLTGAVIAGLVLIGDVRLTWSFSAFTVLLYYAITNLAAIRLERSQRLFHPAVAWAGLVGCLGLAFWIEWRVLLAGAAVLGVGLVVRGVCRRVFTPASNNGVS
ncbi:MAG: amino acid permease [Phycisphaerales bacterium]|nr:MAG: amino acid permease [Phycisphaerales bacterium]